MNTTKNKTLFIEPILLHRFKTKEFKKRKSFRISFSASTILISHKSKKFDIYNGVKYKRFTAKRGMMGSRFGEFFSTRSKYIYKSKKTQKIKR